MAERSLTPTRIVCDATLADGRRCEEEAVGTNVQYKYDRQPMASGRDDYRLQEIRYRAVCPNCGERNVVEQTDGEYQ
jgi:hypothetical protein